MRAAFLSLVAAASLAQCLPQDARAALGAGVTVNDVRGVRLRLAVRQPAASWKVQDVTVAGGTVVHEFVSTLNGQVFAVSWQGPALPDLGLFLGGYYTRYRAAARAPVVRHRLVTVQDTDLVIHSSGHVRDFKGSAWLPAQLPAGFSLSNLQ